MQTKNQNETNTAARNNRKVKKVVKGDNKNNPALMPCDGLYYS